MGFALYFAGFVSGFLVRGTVDSSRDLVVRSIAAAHAVADGARRWGATEREYFEDLLAEGKARFEQDKIRREHATARAARRDTPAPEYVQ